MQTRNKSPNKLREKNAPRKKKNGNSSGDSQTRNDSPSHDLMHLSAETAITNEGHGEPEKKESKKNGQSGKSPTNASGPASQGDKKELAEDHDTQSSTSSIEPEHMVGTNLAATISTKREDGDGELPNGPHAARASEVDSYQDDNNKGNYFVRFGTMWFYIEGENEARDLLDCLSKLFLIRPATKFKCPVCNLKMISLAFLIGHIPACFEGVKMTDTFSKAVVTYEVKPGVLKILQDTTKSKYFTEPQDLLNFDGLPRTVLPPSNSIDYNVLRTKNQKNSGPMPITRAIAITKALKELDQVDTATNPAENFYLQFLKPSKDWPDPIKEEVLNIKNDELKKRKAKIKKGKQVDSPHPQKKTQQPSTNQSQEPSTDPWKGPPAGGQEWPLPPFFYQNMFNQQFQRWAAASGFPPSYPMQQPHIPQDSLNSMPFPPIPSSQHPFSVPQFTVPYVEQTSSPAKRMKKNHTNENEKNKRLSDLLMKGVQEE
jgi:hypothetical protein